MLKYIFFVGIFIFISSCETESEVKLPFSEQKAVRVLTDIQVAEAAFQFANKNEKDSLATQYYNEVFQLNHISQADFDQLLTVLMNHPTLADSIYEKVLLEMSREEKILIPGKGKGTGRVEMK